MSHMPAEGIPISFLGHPRTYISPSYLWDWWVLIDVEYIKVVRNELAGSGIYYKRPAVCVSATFIGLGKGSFRQC